MTADCGERRVLVSFVADELDKDPRVVEMSWGDLCRYFLANPEESPCAVANGPDRCVGRKCPWKSHSRVPKKSMGMVPGVVDGRSVDKNVRALTLLVLDYDHVTQAQAAEVEERLEPWERVLYTTHNHLRGGPDDVCFRVVVLLARGVPADQWHRFLPAAVAYLGISISVLDEEGRVVRQPDPVCRNRSRLYYFPSHPRGAEYGAERSPGRPLDPDEVLAWAAAHPEALPAPHYDESAWEGGGDGLLPEPRAWAEEDARQVAVTAARAFPKTRRHEFSLALAGILRRAGATEADARRIVYEAARAGGSDDPDKRAQTVAHTYGLDDGASLTGYTRLAEVCGESLARAVGDAVADAKNNAFLQEIEVELAVPAAVLPIPAIPSAIPSIPVSSPIPPAVPIDLQSVRDALAKCVASRARSLDRNDKIAAILLRRALAGQALAKPGGAGDPETVRAGAVCGIAPAEAVRSVASDAAWALPTGVPWDAVAEVILLALGATPEAPLGGWRAEVEGHIARARKARRVREAERALEERRLRAAVFSAPPIPPASPAAVLQTSPPPLASLPPILQLNDQSTTVALTLPASQSQISQLNGQPRGILPALFIPQIPILPASPPPIPPSSPPPPPPDDESWRDALRKRGDGSLTPIPHNARVLLECDPVFRGLVQWNEVAKRVEVRAAGGPLARYAGARDPDEVVAGVQDLLASGYDFPVGFNDLGRRVVAVARSRPFDPIRDYLFSIRWDGVPRVDAWLSAYCGAEPGDYARLVGRRWLTALVARGLRPGVKAEHVLVLESPEQGAGKSSVFEVLGGEWYCDTVISLGDKDSHMVPGLYWICELAELVAFRRTGHDQRKSFFSSRVDKFRYPYARGFSESPRRCLFVGTTNDGTYLTDETGNRRYLCVRYTHQDGALVALRRDRDQLLAEAVAIYLAGETCPDCLAASERCPAHRWWFGFREIGITEAEAEKRVVETPARLKVEAWWRSLAPGERPHAVTTMEVAEAALGAVAAQVRDGLLMAVGHALSRLKFRRVRDAGGLRTWRYHATEELLAMPQEQRRVPSMSQAAWGPSPPLRLIGGGGN